MATASEAVRRLSYKVDSDDAVRRIGSVQAAQKGVTAALNEGSAATDINEARTAKLQSRYTELVRQQQGYQALVIRQAGAAADATNAATAANDNYARSSNYVLDILRIATKTAVDHAASWLATAGAVGAAALVLGAFATILGPIIFAYKALKEAIDLTTEAWQLSGKALEEWRQIAEKAAAANLSTDFFQRITRAAKDAKLPIDELTTSLKNLQQFSADKLGGSELDKRLGQLRGAGNFQGNSGVTQLGQANTPEERFRSIVRLVDEAMQKGERLAALDLTSKFLSPAAQSALAADSDYLTKMLKAADEISKKDLVSDADIGRALDLQRRYDAAVSILEQRWHPIQDLLTRGGIELRAAWVGIVEAVAGAVDWAGKLVAKIGELPQPFWDFVKRGANLAATGVAAVAPALGPLGAAAGAGARIVSGATSDQPVQETTAYGEAVNKLAAGLKNVNNVQRAVAETNAVQAAVWKDTSKAIDETTKKTAEAKDQYDRAVESIEKHTARMEADRQAVGLGAGALEEFRARAALTTAALQAGIPVVGDVAKRIDELAKNAGAAGEALAKARIGDSIKFGRSTAFLSQEDVQIATALKGIYPDVATALGSVEAQAMRANSAFRELSTGIENNLTSGLTDIVSGTKSVSQGFSDMAKSILRSIEQVIIKLLIVQPLMQSMQGLFGGGLGSLFGLGGVPGITASGSIAGALGPTSIGGAPLVGLHSGGIVGKEATFLRYVHPAHFNDNTPRFHGGGIAGDEVPIIARRGEGVFTEGQMRALGGGASMPVTVNVVNQVSPTMTVEAKQSIDGRGNRRIELTLDDQQAAALARPGSATQRALRNNFAARPVGVKR